MDNSTSSDKTFAQSQQASDSTTLVNQTLHGGRMVVSIRIKPELKEAFTRRCRRLGLSTCHVAEGLISGWLMGIGEQVELVNHCPTINQVLVREVKRRRRYAVEDESKVVDVGVCAVCGRPGFARAIEKDGVRVLCKADFLRVKKSLVAWKVLAP
jgi:hypothetical protein